MKEIVENEINKKMKELEEVGEDIKPTGIFLDKIDIVKRI